MKPFNVTEPFDLEDLYTEHKLFTISVKVDEGEGANDHVASPPDLSTSKLQVDFDPCVLEDLPLSQMFDVFINGCEIRVLIALLGVNIQPGRAIDLRATYGVSAEIA